MIDGEKSEGTRAILVLYGVPYCHLCAEMESALLRLKQGLSFELCSVDIDGDAELTARFGERIPVLMRGEEEICCYFLDEAALQRCLDGGGASGD